MSCPFPLTTETLATVCAEANGAIAAPNIMARTKSRV